MSTWTHDEYKKILGYKGPSGEDIKKLEDHEYHQFESQVLADSVDWRTKGAVNPVKN
jgi:hypothetical protein